MRKQLTKLKLKNRPLDMFSKKLMGEVLQERYEVQAYIDEGSYG